MIEGNWAREDSARAGDDSAMSAATTRAQRVATAASKLLPTAWQRAAMSGVCATVCLAGAALWLQRVGEKYPVKDWFFWLWAQIWAWEALWVIACLSLGDLLLLRLFRVRELPELEALVVRMALGVTGFVISMFVLGALHLFRPAFAILLPGLCIAANGKRVASALITRARRAQLPHFRGSYGVVFAIGLFCLAIVYLQSMTPAALGCDAMWFHLSAAQDYAREGSLVPFIADWAKTLPQLTSVLHTWAFLLPGMRTEVRWMMALHTEFVLFVFTLIAVVPSVRWLGRREGGHEVAWVAFFLFPELFIYDHTIQGTADHVQAFFALPLLILSLRSSERADSRMAALAGMMAGASMLTKAQATYLVVPIAALLFSQLAFDAVRGAQREQLKNRLLVLFWFGATAFLTMVPHLLKQWVFYKNPFYPFLMDKFPSWPAVPVAKRLFYDHLAPVGSLFGDVKRTARELFTFPFRYTSAHGSLLLGPLFILLLPLALLRREPRIWKAAFVGLAALYAWVSLFATPRNMQTFLPILVAITAATVADLWRRGFVVRAPLCILLSVQAVWGGDQLFFDGYGRIDDSLRLIRSGVEGNANSRFDSYRAGFRALDRELPRSAVVLLHDTYSQLGINRRVLLDWLGFQGLIDYRAMRSARDVYEQLHAAGVTHIAVDPPTSALSRQEEVVFDAFLYRHARSLGKIGDFVVFEMPKQPPAAEDAYSTVCIGLPEYADGVYRVERLGQMDYGPRAEAATPNVALDSQKKLTRLARAHGAKAVIVGAEARLDAAVRAQLLERYEEVVSYRKYTVYLARD